MKFLGLLAASGVATAHTIFVSLEVNGTVMPVSHGIRTPSYDGPITDVGSDSLACNGPPNPTTPSDKIIAVEAGSEVAAIWRKTLTAAANDIMDPSHVGPTMAYLKKVDSALTNKGPGNGWFKIQEEGLENGQWATTKVINKNGRHPIKIPKCIESGEYLLRAEMIALHGAGSYPGAQLYMECAQLRIYNGTGRLTPKTYNIPGIYKVSLKGPN